MLQSLCPPALIYVVFSLVQIIIDTSRGLYNVAFMKFWVAIVFTILLNFLCISGLSVISWMIVFLPFIFMTLIISLLILSFGLDPKSGKVNYQADIYNALNTGEQDLKDLIPDRDDISKQPTTTTIQPTTQTINTTQTKTQGLYYDNYTDSNENTIQSSS